MNVYIVIITDTQHSIVQQQVDTLWKDWTDAAERVRILNILYEQDKDCDLHAHYYQEVVK